MEQEAAGPLRSRPRWRCALRCTLTVASPHSTRMFGTTGPFASPQEKPKTLSIALRFWVFGTWWRFLRGRLPRRTCAVAEFGSKKCGVELVVGWFLRRPWRCHPGRTCKIFLVPPSAQQRHEGERRGFVLRSPKEGLSAGNWRRKVVMCPRRGNDHERGHPRANQLPLGRGTSPPAWDGCSDAPGQWRW